jgi:hypothetical protein
MVLQVITMRMSNLIMLLGLPVLAACVATKAELQSASTELMPTVMVMEREQILQNIGLFIDTCTGPSGGVTTAQAAPAAAVAAQPAAVAGPNPTNAAHLAYAMMNKIACNAVPSQVVLGGGQAQVSNTLGLPNSTTVNFQGIALKALGIQNSNQWVQTWSITPVTDFGDLQRLTLLYGYAVLLSTDVDDSSELVRSFATSWLYVPIGQNTQSSSLPLYQAAGTQLGPAKYLTLPMPTPPLAIPTNGTPQPMDNFVWCETDATINQWCATGMGPSNWPTKLPSKKWVWWDGSQPASAKRAGRYNHHTLYYDEAALQEFLNWIVGATVDTAAGGGATKSGAGILSPAVTNQ